jgi:hypothetical protein
MATGTRFDRDFGYLMPFLDRVAQAASELEDATAGAELSRLMAEEKRRWARIRELLNGARSAPEAARAPFPPALAAREAPARRPPEHPQGPLPLTVGSLRKG